MSTNDVKNLLKRHLRRNRRELIAIGTVASRRFDIHIVDKFSRLKAVRRPVLTWLALVFVLILAIFIQVRQMRSYYLADLPAAGGTMKVGTVGSVSNINPLYAVSDTESALSELVFSSLVKYDGRGSITADIASEWSNNPEGTQYTFKLRDDIFFHDGQPLDADDIVFTFERLQHPDSQSPLASSWQGVKVTKVDDLTVTFSLPTAFAPFLYSLAEIGIIPQHVLGDVSPSQLRGHRFDLAAPIGSGPFVLVDSTAISNPGNIETATVRFRFNRFDNYHLGAPQLENLYVYAYTDREEMIGDYNEGSLAMVEGLEPSDLELSVLSLAESDTTLDPLTDGEHTKLIAAHSTVEAIPQTSIVMLFFNTADTLLQDSALRKALSYALDRKQILALASSYYYESRSPLLPTHLGFDKNLLQPVGDKAIAGQLLDQAGWTVGADSLRYKDGVRLELSIVTQSNSVYPEVLANIQQQFSELGITVKADVLSGDSLQRDYILAHNYQSLLFGVNVSFDPDVFAYWHSSQTQYAGLNLSNYHSTVADSALEGGRTRIDAALRIAKYHTFQNQWITDNPAIALYRPVYIVAYKPRVKGIDIKAISSLSEIYCDVQQWTVNIGPSQMPY